MEKKGEVGNEELENFVFSKCLIFDSDILICFLQQSACQKLQFSKLLLVSDSFVLKGS